jgi:acetyl esterase/lipase
MPTCNRRRLLAAAAVLAGGEAFAQTAQPWPRAGPDLTGTPAAPVVIPAPPEPIGLLSRDAIELWPQGRVPGAAGVNVERLVLERGSPAAHDRAVMHVTRPILEICRPERPNGAAIVLTPGGAYVRLAIDKEGAGGARRFSQAGVTAFVLNYRLPGDGWAAGYDAPLQDAQRAMRLVRSRAAEWSLDPARIGIMGFSAGGHLAASLLTRFDETLYAPVDAHDAVPARPDIAMLCYALMNVRSLRGHDNAPAQPVNERVRAGLAPTFIVHAADDTTVPVADSLAVYQSLSAARVPVEMHLYQEGGHGFGFSLAADRPAARWPDAFEAWARRRGFFG